MAHLVTDLALVKRLAQAHDRRYGDFRTFAKGYLDWSDARLDRTVREIAQSVSEAIDCTACANCCRTMHAGVRPADARRLARHLRLSERGFEEQYLAVSDGEKIIAAAPCPFLCDSRCSVYELRPATCRSFPHLLKREFRSRLMSVWINAEDCPIVFNTLERLIPLTGFRPRR